MTEDERMARTSWGTVRDQALEDPEVESARRQSRRLIEIGEAIWKARTDGGLRHAGLARLAHTRPDIIARVEIGDDTVSLDTMRRIAGALGLDLVLELHPRAEVASASDG
jgi:ribosome-binding protein aMBF1 (putative translation factor)